ncbi:MAG: DUF2130 domain-containing protein [Bacteroidetes bacterium]|nr:DUF2130 domain-containing protein [Bacteroidota bacterium]
MRTEIKCPKCGHQFPMEEAVSEEYKKDLREQMMTYKKQKDEEIARREKEWQDQSIKKDNEHARQLQQEKQQLRQQLEESLRKNISADYENKLRLLEQANKESDEKLKSARLKELEFLQKEQTLQTREAELEISIQRRLQEERGKLSEELRKLEEQKVAARETEYQLRMKELEKQLEDQKKLAEEMRRKAEQGSSQLQGEIQELALETMLQNSFPFDHIGEVGKGVRGADCIQTIRNNFGQECGRIIYESKRTSAFAPEWIEKLKMDMRSLKADMAVIVTRTMPKDMDCFGLRDGVWICSFDEVRALAAVLRDGIIRVFTAAKSHENKGDKMHLLYDYLTGNEFAEQWKAIREGFMGMRLSIQKERDAMEKLWKAREKQLEKVLLNAAHIRGSIEGIAGMDSIDLNLGDESNNLLEE